MQVFGVGKCIDLWKKTGSTQLDQFYDSKKPSGSHGNGARNTAKKHKKVVFDDSLLWPWY